MSGRSPVIGDYQLVTLNVIYYIPDYRHLLNEFIWQTIDIRPRYPRIERFIDHWRREIDAVIKEILISDGDIMATGVRLPHLLRLN